MNENLYCEICGCVEENLIEIEIDGETKLVCRDCLSDCGYVQCDECGEWMSADDLLETADGTHICQNCYDNYYFTCDDCGKIYHVDFEVLVNRRTLDEGVVCETCADRFYNHCDDCGEYFDDDHGHTDRNGTAVCDNCWDTGDWEVCADCGALMRRLDGHYNDWDCEYYCDDCCEAHCGSENFHDYDYKPYPEFQYRSSERDCDSILTFGVELEVDYGDDHNALTDALVALDQPIYMKHDGSLDPEGVEIVTHPASLAYHTYELRWSAITRTCADHDYKSHDTNSCGLHIHVGRRQLADTCVGQSRVAGNLVLLADQLWPQLTVFSRRELDRLEHWADRPHLDLDPDRCYTDTELTAAALRVSNKTRYQAVNLRPTATVEFRLFRGTLRRDTILASIQLVNNMTRYAMAHTPTECHNANWADVIGLTHHEELNSYCLNRGLL